MNRMKSTMGDDFTGWRIWKMLRRKRAKARDVQNRRDPSTLLKAGYGAPADYLLAVGGCGPVILGRRTAEGGCPYKPKLRSVKFRRVMGPHLRPIVPTAKFLETMVATIPSL